MAWVLFFDGECGFCSKAVRMVYALNRNGDVDFAPLQGELAKEMGLTKFADKAGGSMVMLRETDGRVKRQLDADSISRDSRRDGIFLIEPREKPAVAAERRGRVRLAEVGALGVTAVGGQEVIGSGVGGVFYSKGSFNGRTL